MDPPESSLEDFFLKVIKGYLPKRGENSEKGIKKTLPMARRASNMLEYIVKL
jgi:hypothetical protein